jgi:hypothetical protein
MPAHANIEIAYWPLQGRAGATIIPHNVGIHTSRWKGFVRGLDGCKHPLWSACEPTNKTNLQWHNNNMHSKKLRSARTAKNWM